MTTLTKTFELDGFSDTKRSEGLQVSPVVARYGAYVCAKMNCYRTLGFEFCHIKAAEKAAILKTEGPPDLFDHMRLLQSSIAAALQAIGDDAGVLAYELPKFCLTLLFQDVLRLFAYLQDTIFNVLERFFKMTKQDATEAYGLYSQFVQQTEQIDKFMVMCGKYGCTGGKDIPNFSTAPASLLKSLKNHIDSNWAESGKSPSGGEVSLAALIPKMEVLDTSTISAETSAVNTSPRTPSPPSSPEHADSDDEQVGYVEVVAEPSAGDALPVTVSSTSLEVHSPLKPADSAAGSAEAVPVDPQTPTTQPEPAAQPEPTVAPADDVQPAPATTDGDESTGPASATVSQDQLPVFEALWQIAVPAGKDFLAAIPAVNFFRSSGYDNQVLSKIWTLSDSQAPKGQLNQSEFFIALKLIALKQAGQAPSIDAINAVTDLPDLGDKTTEAKAIVAAATKAPDEVSTADVDTSIDAPAPLTFLQVMANMWAKISDKVDAAGTVDGAACRPIMMLSKLEPAILGKIWGKVDANKKGRINYKQFGQVLGLISQLQADQPMDLATIGPNTTPPNLE